jgi:hypothetical protein
VPVQALKRPLTLPQLCCPLPLLRPPSHTPASPSEREQNCPASTPPQRHHLSLLNERRAHTAPTLTRYDECLCFSHFSQFFCFYIIIFLIFYILMLIIEFYFSTQDASFLIAINKRVAPPLFDLKVFQEKHPDLAQNLRVGPQVNFISLFEFIFHVRCQFSEVSYYCTVHY